MDLAGSDSTQRGARGAPAGRCPDRSDWPALPTFSDEIDDWYRLSSFERWADKQRHIAARIARREARRAAA